MFEVQQTNMVKKCLHRIFPCCKIIIFLTAIFLIMYCHNLDWSVKIYSPEVCRLSRCQGLSLRSRPKHSQDKLLSIFLTVKNQMTLSQLFPDHISHHLQLNKDVILNYLSVSGRLVSHTLKMERW